MNIQSRRCSRCPINLPPLDEFKLCALCNGPTTPSPQEPDMDVAHARFEREYREHDRKRQERGDPDPDIEGQIEALQELGRVKSA